MPAGDKENSDPVLKDNKPGLSPVTGGALLYNAPSTTTSSQPCGRAMFTCSYDNAFRLRVHTHLRPPLRRRPPRMGI